MFASYLFYQLTDLALGAGLVWLLLRSLPRTPLARALAPTWLARTPFRRLWLLELPVYAALHAVLLVVCDRGLYPLLLWFTTKFFEPYTFSRFLNIGVAYYSILVIFPVLALRRAWAPGSTRTEKWIAPTTLLFTLLLGWYAAFVEPNRLQVEHVRVTLSTWPEGAPPLRVAVLADIQSPLLTAREREAVAVTNALQPDLILIPGDLVAQSLREDNPVECGRFVAQALRAPLGVYAVNGDVDEYIAGGLEKILEGTPVRLLENESVLLAKEIPVELAGFDPRDPASYHRSLRQSPRASCRIAMVHRPRHARELQGVGFDLVISGHCHGGQVVVPGFGPPITLSPLPREIAAGGLHAIGAGTQLYVSRGVGMEAGFAPLLRLFCPPEITLLTIGGAEPPSPE